MAGEPRQTALVHRTFGGDSILQVPNARVEVRSSTGGVRVFAPASPAVCLAADTATDARLGSCYATQIEVPSFVVPSRRYSLRIELPDGRVLTGETEVPGSFAVERPRTAAFSTCTLPPDSTLELAWARSSGAWAYIAETRMRRLSAALRGRGIELDREPLRLVGLSVAAGDTSIVFPSEFGVFDRLDDDLAEALLAIRAGLPPNVDADLLIAAVDRNYVNWVRGGQFNPSGQIRVPSVRGRGTGVFGSVVPRTFALTTAQDSPFPSCAR